jgi:hypothetical protein
MNDRAQDRLFATRGIASAVLVHLLPARGGHPRVEVARRVLGWSAIAIGLLAGAAAPANGLAENTVLLWFVWIIWATTFLARGEQATAVVAARGASAYLQALEKTGATGLEPATSGVTGRSGHGDASRRMPLNSLICRYLSPSWPHRSAWLSQSSNRGLGHVWATETCLHGQRDVDARPKVPSCHHAVRLSYECAAAGPRARSPGDTACNEKPSFVQRRVPT